MKNFRDAEDDASMDDRRGPFAKANRRLKRFPPNGRRLLNELRAREQEEEIRHFDDAGDDFYH